MKITHRQRTTIGYAFILVLAVTFGQRVWAGWTGSMNGTGLGKATVNVTSPTIKTNKATTATVTFPSASITNAPGYTTTNSLPSGATKGTFAGIKGQAGYIWQNTTKAINGDKTDNSELDGYVTPTAAIAETTLDSITVTIETNDLHGCGPDQSFYTFTWHWTGSGPGAAQQVKFVQYDDPLPADFNSDVSSLPGSSLLAGPFIRYVYYDSECGYCCDFFSEFECETNFNETASASFCAPADPSKVYLVTDGIAVSLPSPCTITCPADIVTNAVTAAGVNVTYPAPVVDGDCNDFTVTCLPASGSVFPIGTNVVTCTANNSAGNESICTFNVRVRGPAEQTTILLTYVQGLSINAQLKNQLARKLSATLTALNFRRTAQACTQLRSFVTQVQSQSGGQLTVDQANFLIGEATRIRTILGCS